MSDEWIDAYPSVLLGPEVETKVKASRFIGQVFPAPDEAAAKAALLGVRKKHHDARHHCSAWLLGEPESLTERSDDDGEPSGTAGPPILQAIHRAKVFRVAVVVTRWFGGTKLGRGGLVRAYDESAALALEAVERITIPRDQALSLGCTWEDVGTVEALLARSAEDIVLVEREFGSDPQFKLMVKRSRVNALVRSFVDGGAGRLMLKDAAGKHLE